MKQNVGHVKLTLTDLNKHRTKIESMLRSKLSVM